jgi:hypothetical protein
MSWSTPSCHVSAHPCPHLNEQPVPGPSDLTAPLDDKAAMGRLVVHRKLYQDLEVQSMLISFFKLGEWGSSVGLWEILRETHSPPASRSTLTLLHIFIPWATCWGPLGAPGFSSGPQILVVAAVGGSHHRIARGFCRYCYRPGVGAGSRRCCCFVEQCSGPYHEGRM